MKGKTQRERESKRNSRGSGGELIFRGGMCKLGYSGLRPGIHYNGVSNIMIQAHALWVVTAMGESPRVEGMER